ncbi:9873_t:CDS:2 [Entrophospora sp. SA101]|nr:9873_t:CDS:2 [Entrophospora sp. SA101]
MWEIQVWGSLTNRQLSYYFEAYLDQIFQEQTRIPHIQKRIQQYDKELSAPDDASDWTRAGCNGSLANVVNEAIKKHEKLQLVTSDKRSNSKEGSKKILVRVLKVSYMTHS